MYSLDVLLIIICGAGLMHGFILAAYFAFIKTRRTKSDIFLAMLLFLMAFRVGKSIVLEFSSDLEFLFIFLGLSTLLLIGPFLYWYIKSLLITTFNLSAFHYLQVTPFLFVLIISPFITERWFVENGRHWAYILLIGIYLHLAFYICVSAIRLHSFRKTILNTQKTKTQENVLKWLKYVLISITFIWVSYVLNIFEDKVPYILGPLIYAIFMYALTFIAYKLKVTKLNSFHLESPHTDTLIYQEILTVLEKDDIYMSSEISLDKLAELTGYSKHIISGTINNYAQMNFNNLINYYRIQKAKEILRMPKPSKLTISSVAFDTGFNSLSSFNAAFKKFVKTTPSLYRNTCN